MADCTRTVEAPAIQKQSFPLSSWVESVFERPDIADIDLVTLRNIPQGMHCADSTLRVPLPDGVWLARMVDEGDVMEDDEYLLTASELVPFVWARVECISLET